MSTKERFLLKNQKIIFFVEILMNNHQLRSVLIKIQDHLSEVDRINLHFLLGNHITRRIRDDRSPHGTLALMESLFDQNKTNEQDVTILINALDNIRCFYAANLLKGNHFLLYQSIYKYRFRLS